MIAIDIKSLFTKEAIAQVLQSYPPIKTPVMEEFYPAGVRKNFPLPKISVEELQKTIRNVPVIKRGTAAYPVRTDALSITEIVPLPIEISDFLDASQLNDLKLLDKAGLRAWRDNKINDLRQVIRKTTEAIAGQSLSGKIKYPMKLDNGALGWYEIDYGTPANFNDLNNGYWDDEDTTIADIFEDLVRISEELEEITVYAQTVKFYAGKSVFATLLNKAKTLEAPKGLDIKITDKEINIGGFRVQRLNERWYDLKNKRYKYVLAPNKLLAVGQEAPFRFFYLAIDDIKAGLQPLPMFINVIEKDNPSGYEIIAKSKPLPVPVVDAMMEARVVSGGGPGGGDGGPGGHGGPGGGPGE